jgi:hypothetical protein
MHEPLTVEEISSNLEFEFENGKDNLLSGHSNPKLSTLTYGGLRKRVIYNAQNGA